MRATLKIGRNQLVLVCVLHSVCILPSLCYADCFCGQVTKGCEEKNSVVKEFQNTEYEYYTCTCRLLVSKRVMIVIIVL